MAAASERAAMFTNRLHRRQREQERELSDSNDALRMSVKGGLMTILSKFASRWQIEQQAEAEADRRNADLQHIIGQKKRLAEQEKFIRSFAEATGGKKSLKEQLEDIVNNAQANQGNGLNQKAFDWLSKQVSAFKES